jgi:hypothetical protein
MRLRLDGERFFFDVDGATLRPNGPWLEAAGVPAPARVRLDCATVVSRSLLGPGDERLPLSPA